MFKRDNETLYSLCKSLTPAELKNEATIREYINIIENLSVLQRKNNDTVNLIKEINKESDEACCELNTFFYGYVFTQYFIKKYNTLFQKIAKFTETKQNQLFLNENAKYVYSTYCIFSSEKLRKKYNDEIIALKIKENKDFFDKMFEYPLDMQQREAIADLEDNVLVIASAGSGKTSTIIGKANYLINNVNVNPSKILILTYTNKAASELQERINVTGLVAATFHKHAIDTVGMITGSKPTLADENLLSQIFLKLFENNKEFQSWFIKFETSYQNLMRDPFDYNTAQEYIADLEKYGNISPYKDMDDKVMKFRSKQEIDIFVYLTELGLDVRYEELYPYDTSDKQHGKYKPDFTIHYNDNKVLYLEHFGIDKDSNVPKWFGDGKKGGWADANRKYQEGIAWKKTIHKIYGTQFAFTTSANFTDGTVYHIIDKIISQYNIPIKPLTHGEKLAKLSRNIKTLKSEMLRFSSSFINLMKANRLDIDDVIKRIGKHDQHKQRNIDVIEHIVRPIYTEYQNYLKINDVVDFTDILLKAAELCETDNPHNFDYILVDEFQDMSIDKYLYLKSLRRKFEQAITNLFCVGDDWQSIYRFAGNDMTLFYDFEKFFGFTSVRKIETTHRFAEPLITQSSNFILRNPQQQKKTVKPETNNFHTDLKFIPYSSEAQERKLIEDIIKNIPQNSTISILARYNYDIEQLNLRNDREVRLMSVHSAKGLESDYVIIIGCRGGIHGFPSLIEDDPVLKYVLSSADDFENAEERRVFYVAITRAKKCAYVLYDDEKRSSFIDEFVKQYTALDLCQRCKNGQVMPFRDGIASNGNYYSLVKCNNPYCDYYETIFYEEVKIYSLASFVSLHFPKSMCEPQMEIINGKTIWRICDDTKNILLELSPRLSVDKVKDIVIVECRHGNIIHRFASDKSVDIPTITKINISIEQIIDFAIEQQKKVVIKYTKYSNEQSERAISQIRYATQKDNPKYGTKTHVVAHCHLRNEERDFKISNITAIKYEDSNIWIERKP